MHLRDGEHSKPSKTAQKDDIKLVGRGGPARGFVADLLAATFAWARMNNTERLSPSVSL